MNAGRTLAAGAGVALFAVSFAGSVIVLAPASLVDLAVSQATDGRLRLAAAEGTLWHGHGMLTTSSGIARTSIFWQFEHSAILRAALVGTLSVAGSAPANIHATFDRIEIGPVEASLPAGLIAAAAGPNDAYGMLGTITVSSDGLTAARAGAGGSARLEWRQAATSLLSISPLGSYRASVALHADGGRLDVQTHEGPLVVSGAGQWNAGGVALTLDARATGPQADRLAGWLRTMVPQQGDGSFRFVWPPPQRPGARS